MNDGIKKISASILLAVLSFVAAYGAMRSQVADLREDSRDMKTHKEQVLQRLSSMEAKMDFLIVEVRRSSRGR